MADSSNTSIDAATAISSFVEPLRAGAALLGFAVGFIATHRSGGGLSESTLHGLLGALLMGPVGWFFGLVLMREAIRANVEDRRAAHDERVMQARVQLAQQLQASGHSIPDALLPEAERKRLGPG